MTKNSWTGFFFYIARVFILLVLLAVLLPKLVNVCSLWISSQAQDEHQPSGNPMRVEDTTRR